MMIKNSKGKIQALNGTTKPLEPTEKPKTKQKK